MAAGLMPQLSVGCRAGLRGADSRGPTHAASEEEGSLLPCGGPGRTGLHRPRPAWWPTGPKERSTTSDKPRSQDGGNPFCFLLAKSHLPCFGPKQAHALMGGCARRHTGHTGCPVARWGSMAPFPV